MQRPEASAPAYASHRSSMSGEARPYSSPTWQAQQYHSQAAYRPASSGMSEREATWHSRALEHASGMSHYDDARAAGEEQRQYERDEYAREREREAGGSLPRALMHPDWIAGRGRWAAGSSSSSGGGGGGDHAAPPPLRALHERSMSSPHHLPAASSLSASYEDRYRGAPARPLALAPPPPPSRQEHDYPRPVSARASQLDSPGSHMAYASSSSGRPAHTLPPPESRYMAGHAYPAPPSLPTRDTLLRSPPSRPAPLRRESSWQHAATERSAAYVESTRRLLDPTLAFPERPYSAHADARRRLDTAHYAPHAEARASPHHAPPAQEPSLPLRAYAPEERRPDTSPELPKRGGARAYFDTPRAAAAQAELPASQQSAMGPPLSVAPPGERSPPGTDALGALDMEPPESAKRLSGRALTAAEKRKGTSTESQTRRLAHLVSEQRRRFSINAGFDELRAAVPTCSEGGESQATILRRAIEYIASLEEMLRRTNGGEGGKWTGAASQADSVSPTYTGSPVASPASMERRAPPLAAAPLAAWQGPKSAPLLNGARDNGDAHSAAWHHGSERADLPPLRPLVARTHSSSSAEHARSPPRSAPLPSAHAREHAAPSQQAHAQSASPPAPAPAQSRKRRASSAAAMPRPAPVSALRLERQHQHQQVDGIPAAE